MVEKNTPSVSNSNSSYRASIPTNDTNLLHIARLVLVKWLSTPTVFLLWTSVYEYRVYVNSFSALCKSIEEIIKRRNVQLQKKYSLELTLNRALPSLVQDIRATLNTTEHLDFALFGIIESNSELSFPVDTKQRIEALKLLERRLKLFSIKLNNYDLMFWKDIRTQYIANLNAMEVIEELFEEKQNSKLFFKEQIQITLQSLIYSIKSNYPKTYKSELQEWGF